MAHIILFRSLPLWSSRLTVRYSTENICYYLHPVPFKILVMRRHCFSTRKNCTNWRTTPHPKHSKKLMEKHRRWSKFPFISRLYTTCTTTYLTLRQHCSIGVLLKMINNEFTSSFILQLRFCNDCNSFKNGKIIITIINVIIL